MKKIINLYKPVGITPLQAIHKFKEKHPDCRGKKMSYPGRLDPMAEGVLLLLVGEENKKMKHYMRLDKEYVAEILLGISTDSHDILGLPTKGENIEISEKELKRKIKKLKGNYKQKIPMFSSIRVKGKPLFYYARKGKTEYIKAPEFIVSIKNVQIEDIYEISSQRLLKEIIKKINLLKGDFRQEEIINAWKNILKNEENENNEGKEKFRVVKVRIACSSGTYIRAIADDVGKVYGGGMLISLKRTKVGRFEVRDALKI